MSLKYHPQILGKSTRICVACEEKNVWTELVCTFVDIAVAL
jgi:hypothetical protein